MQGRLCEVFENQNHIKLPKAKLNTLKGCDLDIREGDNEERWIRKMNQTFSGGLQPDVLADWYTLERQLAEWYVDFQRVTSLDVT